MYAEIVAGPGAASHGHIAPIGVIVVGRLSTAASNKADKPREQRM